MIIQSDYVLDRTVAILLGDCLDLLHVYLIVNIDMTAGVCDDHRFVFIHNVHHKPFLTHRSHSELVFALCCTLHATKLTCIAVVVLPGRVVADQ